MFSSLLLAAAVSPFIASVMEYRPAPGQFINEAPEYEEGDTYADILAKANESLCGEATPGLVSLGSFGGYVTFRFDHPVVNVEGQPDFKIYGNAISNGSEPGIVSVSADVNGNGLPDDPWYELAGSETGKETCLGNFGITYSRPVPHEPVLDPEHKFITDAEYSLWTGADGTSGYIKANESHEQPYWPLWLPEDETELAFSGTRLAPNAVDTSGKETNFKFTAYPWGYADNVPNKALDGFDIGNAIDAAGNRVALTHADFFRVHTGVLATYGWLGECSTEITGAEDLHPEAELSGIASAMAETAGWRLARTGGGSVAVEAAEPVILTLCRADGAVVDILRLQPGLNEIPADMLSDGIYIISGGGKCRKFAK